MDTLGTYGAEKKSVEAVSNLDTKYLIYHVGTPLTKALAEIVEKRPLDPIEYLSRWLYKYKDRNLGEKQRMETMVEIEIKRLERKACIEEEKRLVKNKRLELVEQKQREKLKREVLLRKKLEQDQFLDSSAEKDKNGQNALHRLVAKSNAKSIFIGAVPLLLIERDTQNRTPRDVAQQMGHTSNVEKIDKCVFNLFKKGDIPTLEYLLLNSYEHFQKALDLRSESLHLPDASEEFILTISYVQEKMANFFSLIQEMDEYSTEKLLESQPQLTTCRNNRGETPMHVAILVENIAAVRQIVETDPGAANLTDRFLRLPLHYACALSEIISGLLPENTGNDMLPDLMDKTPAYYKADPTEILNLREFYVIVSPAETAETESLDSTEPVQNISEETINEEGRNSKDSDTALSPENPEES